YPTASTAPSPLPLHDALPISHRRMRLGADERRRESSDGEARECLRFGELDVEREEINRRYAGRREQIVERGRRHVDGSRDPAPADRKSTRLNSSHVAISYAVF